MSQDYPPKTCEIDRLVTHEKLVAAALAGRKTQQRRNGIYGYPGETFLLEGVEFVITDLEHVPLGNMSEADAQAEGFPNMDFYKNIIIEMHSGMKWNDNHPVWVHSFERVNPS
jgi:hypothetical protein